MSDFTVINDISDTLVNLLKEETGKAVSMESPPDAGGDAAGRLSLFLYHINENQHLKNQGRSLDATGRLHYPGLPLNLFYLLTAYAQTRETELQLMARAMQVFADHAVIRGARLRGSLAGTLEEILIYFNPLSIDDMNKLWSLFGSTPYKLSVTYRVATALIDSARVQPGDLVIRRELSFSTVD